MSENTTNINDKAVYTHILQKKMSEKSNSGAARVERAWARHEATTYSDEFTCTALTLVQPGTIGETLYYRTGRLKTI